ncbi:MAG: tetratricopeptide repeat protein [Deltaproteobacteria bacterium]|nr:tetratricopeptide repeat protein [Deltaproteobacteria bacterium]
MNKKLGLNQAGGRAGAVLLVLLPAVWLLLAGGCSAGMPRIEMIQSASQHRLEKLEAQLAREAQDNPGESKPLQRLALVRLRLEKPSEALQSARRAEELAPFEAESLYVLGASYLALDQPQPARKALELSLALDPDFRHAYPPLARALEMLGEDERALETLDTVLRREPDHFLAWEEKARLLLYLGRTDEADLAIDLAISISPELLRLHLFKVDVLIAQGRLTTAGMLISQALEEEPDNSEWLARSADINRRQGRIKEAEDSLFLLQERGGLNPHRHLWLEDILFRTARQDKARELLANLLKEKPGFAPAHLRSARRSLSAGRAAEAMVTLEKLAELTPGDFRVSLLKAAAFFQQGLIAQGEKELKSAVGRAPRAQDVSMLNTWHLLINRRHEEARRELSEYFLHFPKSREALLMQGVLSMMRGEVKEAKSVLDTLPSGYSDARLQFARALLAWLQNEQGEVIRLTARQTDDPRVAWRMAYLGGMALGVKGRPGEGVEVIAPFMQEPRAEGRLHWLGGYLHMMAGSSRVAERVWKEGLSLFPRQPALLEAASRLAMNQKDWKRAADLLEGGLKLEGPHRSLFLERLEDVNNRLRKPDRESGLARFLVAFNPLLPITGGSFGESLYHGFYPADPLQR